jgi:hypothetical protein
VVRTGMKVFVSTQKNHEKSQNGKKFNRVSVFKLHITKSTIRRFSLNSCYVKELLKIIHVKGSQLSS